jgi:hypothetical protein
MSLTPNLLLALSAGTVKIDYTDFERIDRLAELSAEFDYRIDRNWSIISGARYVDGDSTDPQFAFDELFLTLFLNYTPGGREPLGRRLRRPAGCKGALRHPACVLWRRSRMPMRPADIPRQDAA